MHKFRGMRGCYFMEKIFILLIISLLIFSVTGCMNGEQEETKKEKTEAIKIDGEEHIAGNDILQITHSLNTEDYEVEVQIKNDDEWEEWEEFEIKKNTLIIENTTDEDKDFKYSISK